MNSNIFGHKSPVKPSVKTLYNYCNLLIIKSFSTNLLYWGELLILNLAKDNSLQYDQINRIELTIGYSYVIDPLCDITTKHLVVQR